jgi:hypothetical protein
MTGRAARRGTWKGKAPRLKQQGQSRRRHSILAEGGSSFRTEPIRAAGDGSVANSLPVVPLSGPDEARPLFGEWGQ